MTRIFVVLLTLAVIPALAFAGDKPESEAQVDLMPSFGSPTDGADPKHKPKIEAPDKVKAGEWFPVTITVGFKKTHPSLVEHHVRYIALAKGEAELARVYLHPVHTAPKVTFWIALDKTTEIKATEEPTHAGAFFSTKKITVIPRPAKKAKKSK